MAWTDAPPTAEEMGKPASWADAPPTEQELGRPLAAASVAPPPTPPPGSASLPTSLGDAATRVHQGGGLFVTPQRPGIQPDGTLRSEDGDVIGADGKIDFEHSPAREGPLPSPAFFGNAVAGAVQKVGDLVPQGLVSAVASDAGKFVPATIRYAAGLLPSATSMGKLAVQAAAALGPRAEAVAHYLASQRDPAYAAEQQKKGK